MGGAAECVTRRFMFFWVGSPRTHPLNHVQVSLELRALLRREVPHHRLRTERHNKSMPQHCTQHATR